MHHRDCFPLLPPPSAIKYKTQLKLLNAKLFYSGGMVLLKFSSKIWLCLLTNGNVIFARVKTFNLVGRQFRSYNARRIRTSSCNITNRATDSFTFLYELYVRDFGGNKHALTLLRTFRRILILWREKLFTKVTAKKGRCNQYTKALMRFRDDFTIVLNRNNK